jgi:hypothetical protein
MVGVSKLLESSFDNCMGSILGQVGSWVCITSCGVDRALNANMLLRAVLKLGKGCQRLPKARRQYREGYEELEESWV